MARSRWCDERAHTQRPSTGRIRRTIRRTMRRTKRWMVGMSLVHVPSDGTHLAVLQLDDRVAVRVDVSVAGHAVIAHQHGPSIIHQDSREQTASRASRHGAYRTVCWCSSRVCSSEMRRASARRSASDFLRKNVDSASRDCRPPGPAHKAQTERKQRILAYFAPSRATQFTARARATRTRLRLLTACVHTPAPNAANQHIA